MFMKLNLNNKIILCILILISIFQTILIVNRNNKPKEVKTVVENVYFNNVQSLFNEVKNIEDIEIIEMNNFDNKGISIKFVGDYNEVVDILESLKKYKLDDYLINYENNIYSLIIHLFIE